MHEAFGTWLRQGDRPRPLSPTTIQEYERQVAAFATWLTIALEVPWAATSISARRMASYLQYLQTVVQRAPATQLKAVTALRMFGTWLVETGQTADNPARRLRAQAEQPQPPKALDPRIVQRVLDAAYHSGDLRDAVVLELLATSGMRASEVAGIQCDDLERGSRTMWVRICGKGGKVRRVPLPKHVGQLVDQYLAQRAAPRTGPLLMGQRGGITRTTINDIVAAVVQRAALTPAERAQVTPHAFRHTVATALVRQRDIVTAADLLGHTNINTTRRYAKATAQDLEAAVEALASAAPLRQPSAGDPLPPRRPKEPHDA
jgi:site-specific recombinase XerD